MSQPLQTADPVLLDSLSLPNSIVAGEISVHIVVTPSVAAFDDGRFHHARAQGSARDDDENPAAETRRRPHTPRTSHRTLVSFTETQRLASIRSSSAFTRSEYRSPAPDASFRSASARASAWRPER